MDLAGREAEEDAAVLEEALAHQGVEEDVVVPVEASARRAAVVLDLLEEVEEASHRQPAVGGAAVVLAV